MDPNIRRQESGTPQIRRIQRDERGTCHRKPLVSIIQQIAWARAQLWFFAGWCGPMQAWASSAGSHLQSASIFS
jgi:hypothetical protein